MMAARTAWWAAALLSASMLTQACAPRADAGNTGEAAQTNGQVPAPPDAAMGREQPLSPVTGSAGPHARATVTLTRPSQPMGAPFAASLALGDGQTIALAGPDEPADFFMIESVAVLFAPLEPGADTNGIVILYTSSQIGPGHGTERRALVYRVGDDAASRDPALEERLEGAADAADARRRLAGAGQ